MRRRHATKWLAFLILLSWWPALAVAAPEPGKRLALVIGSSHYEVAGSLPNAANDARKFGAFLVAQGFETDIVIDADRRTMADAVSRMSRKLSPDDVALFYFAGHGMQLRGENYLVGTEAHLESEFDVPAETMALGDIIGALEKRAKIALFFIDACRNNPLANRLNEEVEGKTRSIATRGLAPVDTESAGTMVAFAAAPGQLASDGNGQNSPFTTALIDHLSGPGLEIGTAFKRVIRDVRKTTQSRQSPQILSSLALEFYFNDTQPSAGGTQDGAAAPVTDQGKTQSLSIPEPDGGSLVAETDFRRAQRINTPRIWTLFLKKHGQSEQAGPARQLLTQIQPQTPATGSLTPGEREMALLRSTEKRRAIQLALAGKGFDPGTPDGAFGQQTRKALFDFQKSVGIATTGYVNDVTATRLEIPLPEATEDEGLYSSALARLYKVEDFDGLETDPRVLTAIACSPYFEKIYGAFQGHLYVVFKGSVITRNSASQMATRCGGYLASITSAEENRFLSTLINGDKRLFLANEDRDSNVTEKMGAWIGLLRGRNGGWTWAHGEPVRYNKWFEGKSNGGGRGNDFGMFYARLRGIGNVDGLVVDGWSAKSQTDRTSSFIMEMD